MHKVLVKYIHFCLNVWKVIYEQSLKRTDRFLLETVLRYSQQRIKLSQCSYMLILHQDHWLSLNSLYKCDLDESAWTYSLSAMAIYQLSGYWSRMLVVTCVQIYSHHTHVHTSTKTHIFSPVIWFCLLY